MALIARMTIKITHLIGSLDLAGTELALCKLISRTNRESFETRVISLTGNGPVGPKIRQLGIRLEHLNMRRGQPNPVGLIKLIRALRRDRPDVLVTWLVHSNLLGGLAAKLAGGVPVVWNVRHAHVERAATKRLTRVANWMAARLSRHLPHAIVFVSHEGRRWYVERGYPQSKSVVLPNGFNVREFRPSDEARPAVRRELGFDEFAPVIGLVARFHPDKDHANFVHAAARILARRPDARFLLCGEGINWQNARLAAMIDAAEIRNAVRLLGPRHDMPRITCALDISVSSSCTEAFSNVIGEAMACGVPCVVTDVGDSARLIGIAGRVVPARDPAALAAACLELLGSPSQERARLGAIARQRVLQNFSLESVVKQYEQLWQRVAGVADHAGETHARAA